MFLDEKMDLDINQTKLFNDEQIIKQNSNYSKPVIKTKKLNKNSNTKPNSKLFIWHLIYNKTWFYSVTKLKWRPWLVGQKGESISKTPPAYQIK